MKTIAIMQPTYLPWVGYFAMIDRVDEFIFLDCVQFEHRSWQQRNQIKSANGPLWLSMPVQIKGNRDALINEIKISEPENAVAKHLASIAQCYKKTPFFENFFDSFAAVMKENAPKGIDSLNRHIIIWMNDQFGIKTPIILASTIGTTGKKAELLANICTARNATDYLSAPGSREYIEESQDFQKHNINVRYHKYEHPVYQQLYPPFLPYMSALDLLFNSGPESLSILRKGVIS